MAAFSMILRVIAATFAVAHAGLYPDGHWERSTELTTSNADDFVKTNVDAGKTVFIRWIASEGWGWWVKQAPAWNKVVEDFAGNADVVFGDVALSKNQVRQIHGTDQGAGAGGWPTIRYFNKATGYGGKMYEKKTSKAMCDELGPKETYMQQYVEEAGGTSLCNINKTDKGCTEKQVAFIEKWKGKPSDEIAKQLDRLQGMIDKQSDSMKAEALSWAKQRLGIFKQFKAHSEL